MNFTLRENKFKLFICFILLLLISFQNFNGTLSLYNYIYEFIQNDQIFSQNDWIDYVSNSPQYQPLWILKNVGFDLTNDYHIFSIYFIFGIIALFFLNNIISFFFEFKDFDQRLIILVCSAFANFVVFKSVWSSTFLPLMNLQTYCATQLVYPLFYFILKDRFTISSLISALMIFIHFTVAWFPTIILCFYIIIKFKFSNFKFMNILIPLFTFLIMFYLNIDNFDNQNEYSLQAIENILDRSSEESILLLQPPIRILYFIISLLIFLYLKKRIVKNNNLGLLLIIIFNLTIFVQIFGLLWTSLLYKYFSSVSFAYLYFIRSALSS